MELMIALAVLGGVLIGAMLIIAHQSRVICGQAAYMGQERREMSDALMHMVKQDYSWLEHRRELERVLHERRVSNIAGAQPGARDGQLTVAPMREPAGTEVTLPAHGGV